MLDFQNEGRVVTRGHSEWLRYWRPAVLFSREGTTTPPDWIFPGYLIVAWVESKVAQHAPMRVFYLNLRRKGLDELYGEPEGYCVDPQSVVAGDPRITLPAATPPEYIVEGQKKGHSPTWTYYEDRIPRMRQGFLSWCEKWQVTPGSYEPSWWSPVLGL